MTKKRDKARKSRRGAQVGGAGELYRKSIRLITELHESILKEYKESGQWPNKLGEPSEYGFPVEKIHLDEYVIACYYVHGDRHETGAYLYSELFRAC